MIEHLTDEQLTEYANLYKSLIGKSKRLEDFKRFRYDVKSSYHVIRLADECEQILEHGDMNLHRCKEYLKRIRKGEISMEEIYVRFDEYEKRLQKLYETSKAIPDHPDEKAIKKLLMECLEMHYGDLNSIVVNPDAATVALRDIANIVERNRNLL